MVDLPTFRPCGIAQCPNAITPNRLRYMHVQVSQDPAVPTVEIPLCEDHSRLLSAESVAPAAADPTRRVPRTLATLTDGTILPTDPATGEQQIIPTNPQIDALGFPVDGLLVGTTDVVTNSTGLLTGTVDNLLGG